MPHFVYILRCKNGEYYSGLTGNLKRRIFEHKNGLVFSTKLEEPKLIFFSCFNDKKLAIDFEKYLKSNSGRSFRNKHFVK